MSRACLLILPILLFLAMPFGHAHAMSALAKSNNNKQTVEEAPKPEDVLGRTTPRGMVAGFLEAIGHEDFEKAAQYLDLSKIPQSRQKTDGPKLARDLQALLDKGGWFFPASMLSNDVDGKKDDEGLTEDMDRIGSLRGNGKSIEILAQHIQADDAAPIWLVSADTLEQLPTLASSANVDSEPLINKLLPAKMIETKWSGAPIGHWLAVIVLMGLSYVSVWFIVLGVFALLKKIWRRKCHIGSGHVLDAVRLPFSLYLAVWVFGLSSVYMGLSIIVRQNLSQLNVIVAWTAIALLAWRMIDIFVETAQRKIVANGRYFGFSSILFFFRRIVKIIFGLVIFFIILDNLGVDVTAGLAALGIGGIALALGAQKTLENFIGSLSVVIDQPVHIGDFCKVGDVSGTVEDIGMRSTRLRTNERTLVTIPNGDFSTQRIENFARRTRFLLSKKFQLRYDASAEQILAFTQKAQALFFSHEHVNEEGLPVRYLGPGPDGHMMELFFYINVSENNEYLKIQQDLMLRMADLIAELGLYYIIPSQTMLPAVDQMGRRDVPLTTS